MTKEEKEIPENIKGVLRQFASSTSAHGLSHIANSKYSYQKLLWAFVLLINLFMFFFMISRLIVLYTSKPVSTKVEYSYHKEIEFPAVTICNQNMFRLSKLSREDHEVFRAGNEELSTNFTSTLQDRYGQELARSETGDETAGGSSNVRGTTLPQSRVTLDVNYILKTQTLEKINLMNEDQKKDKGHDFNGMIRYCRWNGIACHKGLFLAYWYRKWNWKYGNCFIFNYGVTQNGTKLDPLKVTGSGAENGLFLEIDVEEKEYFPELTTESGIRVSLTEQESNVFPNEEGFNIHPGVSAILSIKAGKIVRSDPFLNGSCYGKIKGPSGHRYTVQNCVQNCSSLAEFFACNCSSLKFAGVNSTRKTCYTEDEKLCAYNVGKRLQENVIDCKAQCPQPCSQTTYSKATSYATLYSNGYIQDVKGRDASIPNEELVKRSFIRLSIYFEDLSVYVIKTEVYYEIANLLSDIGGQLGLWIGVSMVTVVEFFTFVYQFGQYMLERRRNRVQVLAEETENEHSKEQYDT